MGTASSVSNKSKGNNSDDVNALDILKYEIQHLQKATENADALDGYVDRVHENSDELDSSRPSARKSSSRTNQHTVVEKAERSVEDICSYASKIDSQLDNLRGVLGQFRDAAVRRCTTRFTGQRQLAATNNVEKQLSQLDTMIVKTKDRLRALESENTTPRITSSLRKEIEDFEKLRKTLESRQNIKTSSKHRNDDQNDPDEEDTIVDILKWREEALHLKQKYERLMEGKSDIVPLSNRTMDKAQLNKQQLLRQLQMSQHECSAAEYKKTEAVESLQKIEEKLLEERLSHEVEVNSLRAMLEKQNRMINMEREGSKLLLDNGKSNGRAPEETELNNHPNIPDFNYDNLLDKVKHNGEQKQVKAKQINEQNQANLVKKDDGDVNFDDDKMLSNVNQKGTQSQIKVLNINNGAGSITPTQASPTEADSPDIVSQETQSKHSKEEVHLEKLEQVNPESPTAERHEPKSATDGSATLKSENEGIESAQNHDKESEVNRNVKTFVTSIDDDDNKETEINHEDNISNSEHEDDVNQEDDNSLINAPVIAHMTTGHENIDAKLAENIKDDIDEPRSPSSTDIHNSVLETTEEMSSADHQKEIPVEVSSNETEAEVVKAVELREESPDTSNLKKLNGDSQEKDVVLYKQGMMKEIMYRRSDGYIDGNLSYHKGIGAILRTSHPDLGVDSLQVDIIDELETEMLPDFVGGERVISFHLHVQQQYGVQLELAGGSVKLYVPHRRLEEFEEALLICSVNGGDWEPCDLTADKPASVGMGVDILGTELQDVTDVKLVVIARERTVSLIAGESDVHYQSRTDSSVTVHMAKDTFKSRTEVKILVHHSHAREMISAIEIHPECQNIMSCTAFVALTCEHVTRGEITLTIDLPSELSEECRYTIFCLWDAEWKLADCDWKDDDRTLTVHLPAGSRKYRVLGVELPLVMSMEDRLLAVKTLHEHVSHYIVRMLFRQKEDDPSQAVVICFRSNLIKNGIFELKEMGYSLGSYPSAQLCLLDGDKLTIDVTGDVSATPVNSDKMEMTFLSQRDIATKQLLLQQSARPKESPRDLRMIQGTVTVATGGEEPCIVLSETIHLPVQ